MEKVDIGKFKKIWIVYNRHSGKQFFASMLARVNEVLHQLRGIALEVLDLRIIDVNRFGELEQIARDVAAEKVDWVIVAGGDGTIRGLLDLVVKQNYHPYFSIFPAGTVNLMARELMLSKEPVKWVKRAGKGIVHSVHYGLANGHLFLTVAGTGYDSLIVAGVSEVSKKFLSKFAYVVQGAELLRKEFFRKNWRYEFSVRFDDEEQWHRVSTILACKSRYYGGRYMLFDDASLENDYFNVAMFMGKKGTDFTRYLALIGMEALEKDKSIILRKAKKIEIRGNEEDFPVELDGDVITTVPLSIVMVEEPLYFIA